MEFLFRNNESACRSSDNSDRPDVEEVVVEVEEEEEEEGEVEITKLVLALLLSYLDSRLKANMKG